MRPTLPLVLWITVLLTACTSASDQTRSAAEAVAAAVNQEFVVVRTAEEALVAGINALYARRATLDLSPREMDVSEGGLYDTFPGNKYYYKTKPVGGSLYASPGQPVTDALRSQVKFLELVDPILIRASRATDVVAVAFFGVHRPTSMALMEPWSDVVSTLPPGIDLSAFEWYSRGLGSPGAPVWSTQPFTDFTTGWVMDVSAPAKASGDDQGVTVISINLEKLARKHFAHQNVPLLLAGRDGTVVGLSPPAQALLGIRALESVDYLRQVKENTFAPGKYKLADPSQTAEVQAVGRALAGGGAEAEVSLGGRPFLAIRKDVPESGLVVLGFAPR